jgi:malonyl-CoA/methylmalonyl-CoA synthetase
MTNPLFDKLFGCHTGKSTPFIILPDGHTISHDDFLRMTARYANALTNLGLNAGDRVAVQIEKSPEAIAVYAACAQAGLVFLPLNTGYTPDEVGYFVDNSGARIFICDSARQSSLKPIALAANALLETLDADGSGSLSDLAKTMPDSFATVSRNSDDLAAFLYTSGTTGRSKGAMLTQDNLTSNALTLADLWQFSADDVLLHALPIFHTHGLFVAINTTLAAGGAMILLPKFDLDQVIKNLPKATAMMGVPTFYTRLLDDPRFTHDLTRHMRLFTSGSAPLLADTHQQFEAVTGHRILERYGMTETNMTTSNPYDGDRRAGTVGQALPGVEIKITDAKTGEAIPDGEIGILEVRGPNVFKGYWQMPEKTREELREDGFFITGDLALIDQDGYVQIVGRNKDLIISGGYNIYPKEIELVLDEQSGVLESAVIGLPHPDFGESVLAVLVPEKGKQPDLGAISQNITKTLARFKHPKKIILLDQLPRNTMGKVQKNILRDQFNDLFS